MKVVGNILYLEIQDLVAADVSRATVITAKSRNRTGWEFLDAPDGQGFLVRWDTLNESAAAKVERRWGDPRQEYISRCLDEMVRELPRVSAYLRQHYGDLPSKARLDAYGKAQWLDVFVRLKPADRAHLQIGSRSAAAAVVRHAAARHKVGLPSSYSAFLSKARAFVAKDYEDLVDRRLGNSNAVKLDGDALEWVIALYAQPNKPSVKTVAGMYAQIARDRGWPEVSYWSIYRAIKANEPMWYETRHGRSEWSRRFEHSIKLRSASCRDRLWSMDGTKLDLWYQENGKAKTKKIYAVVDDYSEVILAYDLSHTEDSSSIFRAVKRALRFAMAKPEQLLYDNQGGHKTADVAKFFSQISALHFPARPYNAQAKPIERVFGRFQKQVLRGEWNFTGQGIRSKSLDSQANDDFIHANRHRLPTEKELDRRVEQLVATWNEMAHPTLGVSRIEAYRTSVNDNAGTLTAEEVATLTYRFSKPITYGKDGIRMTLSGQPYHWEVLAEDDTPDLDFRAEHLGKRLVIAYDPEDMEIVWLHERRVGRGGEESLVPIAHARPKPVFARAVADAEEGEADLLRRTLQARDEERRRQREKIGRMKEESGVDAEWAFRMGWREGGDKRKMNDAESDLLGGDNDDPLQWVRNGL